MTRSHSPRLLAIACASLLLTGTALAQADSYNYFGLSAGQACSKMNVQSTSDQWLGSGLSTVTNSNLSDTAYKVYLGRQFNPYWGLELGYFDLGRFSFDSATAASRLSARYQVRGVNLDLVGSVPLGERWAATARVGAQSAKTNADYAQMGMLLPAEWSRSNRDTNLKMGLGLQYAFSHSVILRTELERLRVNDDTGRRSNVNVVSVGLVFPFGRSPERARQSTAMAPRQEAAVTVAPMMPVAVPAAAPAMPMVVQPHVAVVPAQRRVSYTVESLFTFDESVIRPEGQTALNGFLRDLSGATYQVISVEGHTDRLGTADYNQALSLRRAEMVRNYLISPGGLPADKITMVGKSESQPVTTHCVGTAPTAQLKACLQPDRRVEIEVVGSR